MKKVFFGPMIIMTGCTSQDESSTPATSGSSDSAETKSSAATNPASPAGCYAWKNGNDSAKLNLQLSGRDVSGTLNYNLYEKDSNKGTIKGSLENDMIVAYYTFQAEGMTSVREVVFKIDGDNLLEGYGDPEVEGDTARFKNKADLEYSTERPFIKTNCN